MASRSRRLQGSLGDSWGDADYSSDGGASIHSASDVESEPGSDSEFEEHGSIHEHEDIATPLPRMRNASSRTPQDTPVRTPASRGSRHSSSPRSTPRSQQRSFQSTPGSQLLEPSFIMPSMQNSVNGLATGSPLRNSQIRARKTRHASQTNSTQSSPRIATRHTSGNMEQPPQQPGPWHYINLFFQHVIRPLGQYFLDVVAFGADFLKPLFAMFIILWLVMTTLRSTSAWVESAYSTAIAPLCVIPGSSYIISHCAVKHDSPGHDVPWEELMDAQSKFEEITEASRDSFALPASMKRSEAGMRDLRTLVKHSKLPSRAQLGVEFENFIETARQASEDLVKYNSKVGNTMDKVININAWTVRHLTGLESKEASYGLVSRALSAINPLQVFVASPSLQREIFEIYVLHVRDVKNEIEALIQVSEALLMILQNLDDRLDFIADLATQDDQHLSRAHDELLSLLWTRLGGNKDDKKALERSLALLREVTASRKHAVTLVQTTVLKLKEINAEVENLRDGVSAPEVLGFSERIPIEYHINAVKAQLERLSKARGEQQTLQGEASRGMIDRGFAAVEDRLGWERREETPMINAKGRGKK
ncbi:hypothetical protein BDV96DRAFT_581118 [Lophiotrema nucula]|uniref:Uncharacterized protein n=1 Tax=Lophiotrema nucula TaxID=690887 RepID=A0A6A5YY28_9PLEO|nr:hypothetical protein BDV96DRAFT_581118 [Lophiotrema nucula]